MSSTAGKKIKAFREANHWSQHQLAQQLNCSQAMISMIERGELDLDAAMTMELAGMASRAEFADYQTYFLKRAQSYLPHLLELCEEIQKRRGKPLAGPIVEGEIVRIETFHHTLHGRVPAGPPVPLPSQFVPHLESTIGIFGDKASTALVDAPRGLMLLDTSCEGVEHLQGLWGRVVMMEFLPSLNPILMEREGIYVGRLHIEGYGSPGRPDAAVMRAFLASLTDTKWAATDFAFYNEPQSFRGVDQDDPKAMAARWDEVRQRAESGLRLPNGVKILGRLIGRLSGHLDTEQVKGG